MSTSTWDSAERPKVVILAKDLRSSALTKTAVMQGKNVSYVKGSKLIAFYVERGHTAADAAAIGNAFVREGLTLRAELLDPKRRTLRPSQGDPKVFDENCFYVWNFEGSTGMRNFLLIAIVVAFFGLVLFPVWPQGAKVGVWYVSMTLLLVLLGFIFLRLIVFCLLYAVGIDFWILPNFFSDEAGFWDSFKPIYSFHASLQSIKDTLVYRAAAIICLVVLAYWVLTQPTEFDEFVASQRAFVDELYEGTLLSDKSQKEKEQIDKVVPDLATVEKELEELEKLSHAQTKEDQIDQKLEEMIAKESESADEEEVADL